MYEEDYFNPVDPNDYDNDLKEDLIAKSLREDRGLNTLIRKVTLDSGKIKNKRIRVFTSSGSGTRIRDAETGEFYQNKVGWFSGDIPKRDIIDEKTGKKIGTVQVMARDEFNKYKQKI